MRCCTACNKQQEDEAFHAENKTGWSKICKTCRKIAHQKQYNKVYYSRRKIIKELSKQDRAQHTRILENKIEQLHREHKQFTISNRARIKQITDKINAGADDLRSVKALERRMDSQREADAILSGQIQLVSAGITPQHISIIWRMNHGNDARKESERPNQETIGCESDISLLPVYGGNG
jgi:hypothetical protein